jgi:hypothetical protein
MKQCKNWTKNITFNHEKNQSKKKIKRSWLGAVGHTCNPSYSGSTDQEDCSSKSAQAKSFRDPISKIPNTQHTQKDIGRVAQVAVPA